MTDPGQGTHRVRALLGAVVTLTALILTGCATFKNTPQQDYVYEMGHICESANGITSTKMERVASDGRYWIMGRGAGYEFEYPRFFACMKEQFQTHPFLDWLKAQKRETQQPLVAAGSTSGIGTAQPGPAMAPIWQVGDEWQYAYKSPSDSGTYVWSVNRVEVLDGAPHYVIKTGTREIFYRVSDIAASLEKVDGTVVLHDTPSRIHYSWPLSVGKTWEQDYRQERPVDRQTFNRSTVWTIETEEAVTVPAGTFKAIKITSKNKNNGATIYEMWYVPEVKQWIKIREILTNGIRERELISFKLK